MKRAHEKTPSQITSASLFTLQLHSVPNLFWQEELVAVTGASAPAYAPSSQHSPSRQVFDCVRPLTKRMRHTYKYMYATVGCYIVVSNRI